MAGFDFLERLQDRAALSRPSEALAMAAAVLSPLYAHLESGHQAALRAILPPALNRSVLLQMSTTTPYTSLERYVSQVANQEGRNRDEAVVHIALVLCLLAPQLSIPLRAALVPDFRGLPPR